MEWGEWLQQQAGALVGAWADKEYRQPYELERLRLQAYGDIGYYEEGQPGVMRPRQAAMPAGWLLLAGAALLVVLLVKD